MKKFLLIMLGVILVVVGVVGAVGACSSRPWVTASGNIETRTYGMTGFTRVETGGAFDVEINYAKTYSVSITTSDNLFDYIEVKMVESTLSIQPKLLMFFRKADFKATITLPELSGVTISGASTGAVDGFLASKSLDIEVSGASHMAITNVKATDVKTEVSGASRLTGSLETKNGDFVISGASQLELKGTADAVTLEASGASSLRLADFPTGDANIVLSGASNGNVTVNGRIDIEVSGASRLTYAGDPTLGRIDVSGASSISRR